MNCTPLALLTRTVLAVALILSPSRAQESAPDAAPPATAHSYDPENPKASIERIELLLKPLDREELAVELEAWKDALAERTRVLADKRIENMDAGSGPKPVRVDEINRLRADKAAVAERFQKVIKHAKAKGVDTAEFEEFAKASAGLEVDLFDPAEAGSAVVDWLTSPEGGIRLALNIIKFLATLFVFAVASRLIARIVRRAMSKVDAASALLKDFAVSTARKLVFFIGLVIALSMLGIDIGPFIAAIGAAGFIIGFALQGTLSNFAAGIMILIYRPYDVGEVVTVAGQTGKVDAMSLVATTLRLFDNQIVVVPNNSIWGDVITNVTGVKTRRVDMKFGCGYGDDLQHVQRLLTEIVSSHPKVLKEPEPVIRVHELADSCVNFVVRPWANTGDYWDVCWDVTRQVKDRFDAEGLNIPFPQTDVHLHGSGDAPAAAAE